MKEQDGRKTWHPPVETLALVANSDLPWRLRWRVRRHAGHCADCQSQISLFRRARAELRREAQSETLTGFEAIADWERLEREMMGNIAVGLAAARCVDSARRGRVLLVRAALVFGLTALFVVGWITHIPSEQTQHLFASLRRAAGFERPQPLGTILRTTPDGIAVRAQGSTLTILHPASAVVTLSGNSAVAARYVDEETGQVTITKVYAQ